jgi:hypothetical protein
MRLTWFRTVQVLGFIRKELVEILRQPKLVATLVFGPFAEINYIGLDGEGRSHDFNAALGGRLGFLLNPRLLAYLNGGVEFAAIDKDDGETYGFAGGGLELLIFDGWSLTGEGRITFASEELAGGEVENAYSVRAFVNKRF